MEELHFIIRHPDGREERSLVQSTRTIVGSGAHCDIRLSPDQAAFEHVAMEITPDGARIQRLANSPAATLDGAEFAIAALASTATLTVGRTTIQIGRKTTSDDANKRNKSGVSLVARGGVLLVLGCAIAFLSNLPKAGRETPPADIPDLFGNGSKTAVAVTCPRGDRAEAKAIAEDNRAIADGARERSPFEPRGAVTAVKSYDLASACYRAAGDVDAADEAGRNAREIQADTLAELRARRVRLEHMLAVKDHEIARQDVLVLRALFQGHRGEYVSWLARVDQDLKAQKVEKK